MSLPENGLLNATSRQPSVIVTANGLEVANILDVKIHRNNFFAADNFSIAIPSGSGATPAWMQTDSIEIEVKIAQDVGSSQSVITGMVDDLSFNVESGLIALKGRDLTSVFIETKTAEKFQNLTSSQVVTTLADRHGLNSQATQTSTPTGKFYESDHSVVTNEISEWTLLTYLAEREGFDIFVEGQTLYFQPQANLNTDTPYDIFCVTSGAFPVANVNRLVLNRNLTLARDVIVKVISWSHEMKAPITVVVRAEKIKGEQNTTSAPPTTYIFREVGLTQSQAYAFATTKLNELTLHERRIDFEMPGDLSLTPRSVVRLSGTGTDFDQTYYAAQLTLTCSTKVGFSMRVMAKNASPHKLVYG